MFGARSGKQRVQYLSLPAENSCQMTYILSPLFCVIGIIPINLDNRRLDTSFCSTECSKLVKSAINQGKVEVFTRTRLQTRFQQLDQIQLQHPMAASTTTLSLGGNPRTRLPLLLAGTGNIQPLGAGPRYSCLFHLCGSGDSQTV